jgi:SAM-dependent methyltransferase
MLSMRPRLRSIRHISYADAEPYAPLMAVGNLGLRGAWNHNTHYNRLVLAALPTHAARALDVGCGEGDLVAELASAVPSAVGIDVEAEILRHAAHVAPAAELINGDFLTYPLDAESFDLVAAIASLHHMDLRAALRRVAGVLRPGGVAVLVGLARPASLTDYLIEAVGVVASRLMRVFVGYKDVRAPTVWPPPLTYAECRQIGLVELAGAKFRRRLFFRYSLVWTKPESE